MPVDGSNNLWRTCMLVEVDHHRRMQPQPAEHAEQPAPSRATGNREFTVWLKVCHVLFLEHTTKSQYAVRRKQNTRRNKSTRRRLSSPCAPTTTHGEAGSTCAGRPSTLTAVDCGSTPSNFAVSHRFAHGEPYSLPCASVQHTATSWTR